MYCPQCRVEYREGFSECSDCHVPLVAELPAEPAREPAPDTAVVLVTEDALLLNDSIAQLENAGIGCMLESGGSILPEGEQPDLGRGAITLRVLSDDEAGAVECLRTTLEQYSLTEEDLEELDEALAAEHEDGPAGSPLVAALAAHNYSRAEALLESGADPNATDEAGRTPLMYAARDSDWQLVEALLKVGGDPNAADSCGGTALHLAAHAGAAPVVKLLVDHSADLNPRTSNGLTPLMLAAEYGRLECLALLLVAGADAAIQDPNGETAQSLAANMGFTRIEAAFELRARVESGLANEAADDDGRTCLMSAAIDGDDELIRALIDLGADREATDSEGRSALIRAVIEGQTAAVESLIAKGVNVDATDREGCTGLSWAAAQGNAAAVEILLSAGADPTLTDSQGWTPLKFAEEKMYLQVAATLRSAMAERVDA